jgi:hypothetical protein
VKGPDVTSTPQPPGSADTGPAAPARISHQHMDQALASGHAVPLGATIRWFARYQDAWWLSASTGWIRCDDPQLSAELDDRHATLTALDNHTARHAGIQAALAAEPQEHGEPADPGVAAD